MTAARCLPAPRLPGRRTPRAGQVLGPAVRPEQSSARWWSGRTAAAPRSGPARLARRHPAGGRQRRAGSDRGPGRGAARSPPARWPPDPAGHARAADRPAAGARGAVRSREPRFRLGGRLGQGRRHPAAGVGRLRPVRNGHRLSHHGGGSHRQLRSPSAAAATPPRRSRGPTPGDGRRPHHDPGSASDPQQGSLRPRTSQRPPTEVSTPTSTSTRPAPSRARSTASSPTRSARSAACSRTRSERSPGRSAACCRTRSAR